MNKTAKKVVATILTTVMTVGAATVVSADDLSITLSHQPYSHALPSYIGEEEGIFEENGLNTEILWFSSGNTQNEALGANEWDAGACGTPPAIAAGIAYNAKIVGFSVDDTVSVDYWVRADSDIAAISGEVEGYPDILGNADTWKGKTILCPTQTSAHYMLIASSEWLIQKKDIGFRCIGSCDSNTLFHTTGKLFRKRILKSFQSNQIDVFLSFFLTYFFVNAF